MNDTSAILGCLSNLLNGSNISDHTLRCIHNSAPVKIALSVCLNACSNLRMNKLSFMKFDI